MLLAATSLLLPVPASLVALTPAQDAQRVLFVGNSLTYVGDIPGLIERLARATGARPVDTTCACLPGISLADQLEGSLARDAIARGGWDAVVLQEESQVTFLGGDTGPALDTFTRLLDGRTARTLLFAIRVGDFAKADPERADRTTWCHASRLGDEVAPVGPVWDALAARDPAFDPYGGDHHHPGPAGAGAAAAVLLASLQPDWRPEAPLVVRHRPLQVWHLLAGGPVMWSADTATTRFVVDETARLRALDCASFAPGG